MQKGIKFTKNDALRLYAWSAFAIALSGCHTTSTRLANNGQDLERVSRAEYDLARGEWEQGRLRSAMEHAMRACEADENHSEAHDFVANLYLALCQKEGDCRFEVAEKYARKAIAIDAENRFAKQRLGVILVLQKKYDDALNVLRPLANDILYKTPWLAWNELGIAYLEKGDVPNAIDALTRAIALKPDFCWATYRLGVAYEKQGDFSRAEHELTKAIEPEDPACKNLQDAYQARGRIRARLGRNDLARQDFETCTKLSRTTPNGRLCEIALQGVPR